MKYLFVITGYEDEILGIQEVIPDMKEVEEKKGLENYEGMLSNHKIETIVQYATLGYFSLENVPTSAKDIAEYDPHWQIAVIFDDFKWMREHYNGPINEPSYY